MFNRYVWDNYLQSGGSNTVELFRQSLTEEITQDFVCEIRKLHRIYMPNEKKLDLETEQLEDVKDFIQQRHSRNENDTDEAPVTQNKEAHDNVDWYKLTEEVLSDIYLWLSDDGKNADKETFEEFTYSLAYYSTLFAIDFPELFVPYYFQLNFNVLELIASEFDIALPIIPIKKDYKGRFFYYGEVCFALKEFQRKYELDDY